MAKGVSDILPSARGPVNYLLVENQFVPVAACCTHGLPQQLLALLQHQWFWCASTAFIVVPDAADHIPPLLNWTSHCAQLLPGCDEENATEPQEIAEGKYTQGASTAVIYGTMCGVAESSWLPAYSNLNRPAVQCAPGTVILESSMHPTHVK